MGGTEERVSAREEAARLLAAGFRVWPIDRVTRRPARAGFARANGPDVSAVADEFDDRYEVGVLAGPCPAAGPGARYVVVDYDGPVPSEARVGGLPTLTSKQGAHEWYRIPADVTGFRQTQGLRRGDGWAVDTRDFGGYARETAAGQPLWDQGPTRPRDLTQTEVDALFGSSTPTPTPYEPPARRTTPSTASVASFVHRVVANPDGTNAAFGAVGAALAAWGWADDDIADALRAWFAGAPGLPGRHLDSAVRAARTRRAGGVVPGFPALAEMGVAWAPTVPDGGDVWAALDAPSPPVGDTFGGVRIVSAAAIAAWTPPPIAWVCEALGLAPGAPGLLAGYGGSGKTTFAQHLALAVATPGRALLEAYPVRHGRVVHLDHEQGLDLTQRRYQTLGITAEATLDLVSLPAWSLADAGAEPRGAFLRFIRGAVLVVIDSFLASCAGFLENGESDSSARFPLDWLTAASAHTGATFLVIHHTRKDRSNSRISARGTSAINDAVSVSMSFEKEDDDDRTSPAALRLTKVRYDSPRVLRGAVRVRLDGAGRPVVVSEADAADRKSVV